MRLTTAPQLPKIGSRTHGRGVSLNSIPFESVIKDIQADHPPLITRDRKKTLEVFVPAGIKSYAETHLQELSVRPGFSNRDYKDKYMRILNNNPYAFHKQTGEFTLYSDFSVKINRVGPYNKKK